MAKHYIWIRRSKEWYPTQNKLLAFSETYAPIGKQHTKQFKEMEATSVLAGTSLLNPKPSVKF